MPQLAVTQSSPDLGGSSSSKNGGMRPFEILHALHNATTVGKIEMSVTKDYFRKPQLLRRNTHASADKIFDLTQRLKFKFFEKFSESQIKDLVKVLDIVYKPAGEYIFHEGDIGDKVYLIYLGEVDVMVGDTSEPTFVLGPGQSFGEMALGLDCHRSSTVRCNCASALGVLSRDIFARATKHQKMIESSRIISLLEAIPPFSALHHRLHLYMAKHMSQLRVPTGYEIPPEEFDDLFVMPLSGTFEIRGTIVIGPQAFASYNRGNPELNAQKHQSFERIPLFLLNKGHFFNDDLFMNSHVDHEIVSRDYIPDMFFRDFYCIARVPARLMTMNRKPFQKLLRRDKTLTQRLQHRQNMALVHTKDVMMQIAFLLVKPDFHSKIAQYIKKMLELLEGASTVMNKAVQAYDKMIHAEGLKEKVSHDLQRKTLAKVEAVDQNIESYLVGKSLKSIVGDRKL